MQVVLTSHISCNESVRALLGRWRGGREGRREAVEVEPIVREVEVQEEEESKDIHEEVEDEKEQEEEQMEDDIPDKEFFGEKSPVFVLADGKEIGDGIDDLKNSEEVLTNFFDKPRLAKQAQQKMRKKLAQMKN